MTDFGYWGWRRIWPGMEEEMFLRALIVSIVAASSLLVGSVLSTQATQVLAEGGSQGTTTTNWVGTTTVNGFECFLVSPYTNDLYISYQSHELVGPNADSAVLQCQVQTSERPPHNEYFFGYPCDTDAGHTTDTIQYENTAGLLSFRCTVVNT